MENQNQEHSASSGSFWRSRAGTAFLVFLAIAALLLGYEHRAHLFVGNGLLVLLLLGFVGMHFFMHRGHGGSRNGGDDGDAKNVDDNP
jgi:hypothetical protein